MATRNINLTDALDRFVAEKVASGSYQNASEVVRAGLRLLQDEEALRAERIKRLSAERPPAPDQSAKPFAPARGRRKGER